MKVRAILNWDSPVCPGMPKVVKKANLQYLLRNGRLDCFDLLLTDRPTLRLISLDLA